MFLTLSIKKTPHFHRRNFIITIVVVQCLSLLHVFAKQCLNSDSAHCQWVTIDDNHLKRLICLGYWRKKQRKFLVSVGEAKANINFVE